jgi:hypothetical protein
VRVEEDLVAMRVRVEVVLAATARDLQVGLDEANAAQACHPLVTRRLSPVIAVREDGGSRPAS